ncbi:MAG: ATP-binding cassette domain-containing protein, partial [Clostridium sp.]
VGFELPNLYEQLTIYENLKSFSKLYSKPASIIELLKRVGLDEHKDKKVSEISKGMKMRLNFCRALIGSPEIIFLDEPTSGLDPNNTRVIQEMILEQELKGRTIVLTTHNMNFAEHICSRVAFIVDGEIKAISKPEDLKNKYGDKKIHIETKSGSYEYKIGGLGKNAEFIKLLDEDIEKIETRQPNLEDIFTIVTGRVLV